jgi:iron complex outermembrane receptor protein
MPAFYHVLHRGGLIAAAAVCGLAAPVSAQARQYDIPSQPASTAITMLADQAGVQILLPGRVASGVRTRDVRGVMSFDQAVAHMFSGTSVKLRRTGERTYTLVEAPKKASGIAYAPVRYADNAMAPSAAAVAAAAPVAEAPDASADGAIGDIVVTARRVSESLQRTPVAVTALSAQALERAQLTSVTQLQSAAPGLTFSIAPAQPGSTIIFMRGQGAPDGLIAVDQSIGTYVNGVYAARSTGGAFDLVDVERVEVLRGPQGTLFGRNTNGGAINIIPKEPTGRFEGHQRVEYGNYDAWLSQTVLNVPVVGEELALRVAYQHREHGSYGYNVTLNRGEGSENSEFVRTSVKFAPAELPITVLLQGDYSDSRTNGLIRGLKSFTPTGVNTALLDACSAGPLASFCPFGVPGGDTLANYVYGQNGNDNIFRVYNDRPGKARSRAYGFTATIDAELGENLALKSISAWRGVHLRTVSDSDGTPYLIIGVVDNDFIEVEQDQFSQELQLTGKLLEDRLEFIFGGFYFVENGIDYSPGASFYPINPNYLVVDADVRNASKAGYGQLTYHLTDSLRLTAGGRYTQDRRRLAIRNRSVDLFTGVTTPGYLPTDGDPSDPFLATARRKYSYWSYTLNVDWEFSRGMFVYAKTNRGYRSGGLNTRAVTGGVPPIAFDPEKLTDYEIGGKFDMLDGHMRLNVAAYRSDISNLQRSLSGLSGGRTVSGIVNAAKARIQGVEAELTVIPVTGLTLGGSLAYTDAKYKRFINPLDGFNYSNTEFPFTPKWTFSVSADYDVPLEGLGTLNFHADYSHRTKAYYSGLFVPTNTPAQNRVLQETAAIKGYGLLNARIAFRLENPGLEFAVFGRNLTKENYFTHLLAFENNALGITSYTPGDPRTYGISATYRF